MLGVDLSLSVDDWSHVEEWLDCSQISQVQLCCEEW